MTNPDIDVLFPCTRVGREDRLPREFPASHKIAKVPLTHSLTGFTNYITLHLA